MAKLSLSNVRPQPVLAPFDTCVLPHFPTVGIPRAAPASRPRPPEYARNDDGGRPTDRVGIDRRHALDDCRLIAFVTGLAASALGILVMVRLLRDLLYDVPPFDPIAVGGAVVILVAAVAIALLIPVRRATRVDPILALRAE